MRLNNKTTLIYLFFTALVLFLSGFISIKILENKINKSIEQRFEHNVLRISDHISKDEEIVKHKKNRFIEITEISKEQYGNFVETKDTLILPHNYTEEKPFRLKTAHRLINNTYYEISLYYSLREYNESRNFIIKILVIVFCAIITLFLSFNIFISNYLWKPFSRILKHMESYSLNQKKSTIEFKTNTKEFNQLKNHYNGLIKQIENDYQKLKEYTENMAHEIQTPLAIIRNKTVNLLSNEEIMSIDDTTIKAIYDETNHLSQLSTTLNLLTKIENKEFKNIENLNISKNIENHLIRIQEIASLKNIQIKKDLNKDLFFEIDKYLFDILFKNLIKNAIRHSEEKQIIYIESDLNSFTIKNQGEKLSCESDKIFQRFYKSDKEGNSLGLGLAIVKKICDNNKLAIIYSFENGFHSFKISKE